jgi:hypothetical protein
MKLSTWIALGLICGLTGCAKLPRNQQPGYTPEEEANRQTVAHYESILTEREQDAERIKVELMHAPVANRAEELNAYQEAQESCVQAAKRVQEVLRDSYQRAQASGSEDWIKEIENRNRVLDAYRSKTEEQLRAVYVEATPALSSELRDDIRRGRVRVGMSPEQARIAWGKPIEVKILGTDANPTEEWIYPNRHRLFFDGGRLSSLETGTNP